MEELKPVNEKERITLEYTAKGFANWTISLKEGEIKFLNNLNGDMGTKYRLPKWAIKEIEERIKILEKQI